MKDLVIYYSRKGSNHFLAERIAASLNCEIEELRPRLNVFFLFLFNINPGIWKVRHKIEAYDRIILCGPVWMGRFIPPLRSFVKRYKKQISSLAFVTCCGSTYEKKEEKFGHAHVFRIVEKELEGKCTVCQAFPIDLVLPADKKGDSEAFMNTHLNEENFKGEILEIYEAFIQKIAS